MADHASPDEYAVTARIGDAQIRDADVDAVDQPDTHAILIVGVPARVRVVIPAHHEGGIGASGERHVASSADGQQSGALAVEFVLLGQDQHPIAEVDVLAVGRGKQKTIKGWKRPVKKS